MTSRTVLGLATGAIYAFLFLPLAAVILLAFATNQFGGFPIEGVTLQWFADLWANDAILAAVRTSLVLGLATALISTAIGVLAALAMVRHDFPGKAWVAGVLLAPLLVPEVVLAAALLLFLSWMGVPRSFPLLLAGHVIFALPFVILVIQARLTGLDPAYEDAAKSLGASPVQAFFRTTLPLLTPALLAGALFAFTISFDNITGTLFWKPGGTETVPTQIYAMLRDSVSPEVNALGAVMVVGTVLVFLVGLSAMRVSYHERTD
ncbi:ABC transporter permease [Alteraurantiacibacter aestuarii]|uniref:ABC transporter permease subunit n=1 Tax=Alteraurantiacibacter aestuarii TaxID=650004 RepID=A0A844ZMP5_9SPHN|nr:ABC transporter permease [Alteraurantiacibacter aestuarii]MXO88117.1 ABC transporter permease subunit [Alteraurantiacibacter aestuarii]